MNGTDLSALPASAALRIRSIGIMTDSDNTGGDAEAYYGDISFQRAGMPAR